MFVGSLADGGVDGKAGGWTGGIESPEPSAGDDRRQSAADLARTADRLTRPAGEEERVSAFPDVIMQMHPQDARYVGRNVDVAPAP